MNSLFRGFAASNSVVSGISGSGKTAFMQRIALSALKAGGQAIILDLGGSYASLCRSRPSRHISLHGDRLPHLNPFSWADPQFGGHELAFEEGPGLLAILARMASPTTALTSDELARLKDALYMVCRKYGREAEPQLIADYLLNGPPGFGGASHRLGRQMHPFTRGGIYGEAFNGRGAFDLDASLVVIDLDTQCPPELRPALLTSLMYRVSRQLSTTGRSVGAKSLPPAVALIDEAFSWLGDSAEAADWVHECFMRAHYGASWMVAGQGLADFLEGTPAALTAFDLASDRFFLRQDPSQIESLKQRGRLRLNETEQAALAALQSLPGQYAEMLVQTPAGAVVARLPWVALDRVMSPDLLPGQEILSGVAS